MRMRVERRKYPRVKADPSFVLVCTNPDFETKKGGTPNLALKLLDLGPKGLCAVTVGRLREGINLVVAIIAGDSRYKAKAQVRWSQTINHKGREAHVTGMEFMEILEAYGEKVRFMTVWAKGASPEPHPQVDYARDMRQSAIRSAQVLCIPKGFWGAIGMSSNVGKSLIGVKSGMVHIVCVKKLDEGQKVELRIDFQNPTTFVVGQAKVLSCKRNTMVLEPRFETELAFTEMSEEDRERWFDIQRTFQS